MLLSLILHMVIQQVFFVKLLKLCPLPNRTLMQEIPQQLKAARALYEAGVDVVKVGIDQVLFVQHVYCG